MYFKLPITGRVKNIKATQRRSCYLTFTLSGVSQNRNRLFLAAFKMGDFELIKSLLRFFSHPTHHTESGKGLAMFEGVWGVYIDNIHKVY